MSEEDVVKKLDLIARLLALFITQEEKSKNKKVMKLLEYGFEPDEITELLKMELRRVNEAIKRQTP